MIDIIIGSYNRLHFLQRTLDMLRGQTCYIIIADDGSDDKPVFTPEVHKYAWTKHDAYSRVARFNEGLAYCECDYVVFLDDDCIPVSKNFAAEYTRLLSVNQVVKGLFLTEDGSVKEAPWFSTCNIGFQTKFIKDIGGFDPAYNGRYGYEDADLGLEVRRRNAIPALGNFDTSVKHEGKPYAGDRSGGEQNRDYYCKKWNIQ